MLLFDLLHAFSAPTDTIWGVIGFDMLMIVSGLIAGFMPNPLRWYLFTFGVACFGPVLHSVINTRSTDPSLGRLRLLLVGSWIGYPTIWVLAEGAHVMTLSQEVLCYGCLDVLAKAIFGFLLLQREHMRKQDELSSISSSSNPQALYGFAMHSQALCTDQL